MNRNIIRETIAILLALLVTASTAMGQEYCWKDTYGRGVGTIPSDCAYSQQKQGLLCYPKCRAGFSGVASVCWQDCPTGFFDDGAFCRKTGSYGRGVGYAWQIQDGINNAGMLARCQASEGRSCEMWGAIAYPTCKAGYSNVGANVCSQGCPAGMVDMGVSCTKQSFVRETASGNCALGQVYDGGLCYTPCKAGYNGLGPVCGQTCPANLPYGCGAGCAKNYEACVVTTNDQVMNVLSVATDIALAIVTFGGSTAVEVGAKTAAQQASEAGVKAATKLAVSAAAKNMSKNITKTTFRTTIKQFLIQQGKDLPQTTIDNLYETLAVQGTLAFTAQLEGEMVPDFDFYSLDPTGIASVVKAYNHSVCAAPPASSPVQMSGAIADTTPTRIEQLPWQLAPGMDQVSDISVGDDGTVWVANLGFGVSRQRPGEKVWQNMAALGGLDGYIVHRIASNTFDTAYAVTAASPVDLAEGRGGIFKLTGSRWIKMPGTAVDVAVDQIGTVFVIGAGGGIYKMAVGDSVWTAMPGLEESLLNAGKAIRIGAGGVEQVWIVTDRGIDLKWIGNDPFRPQAKQVWYYMGAQPSVSYPLSDIAVGPDGNGWEAFTSALPLWVDKQGSKTFLPNLYANANVQAIAVGGNRRVWGVAGGRPYMFLGKK